MLTSESTRSAWRQTRRSTARCCSNELAIQHATDARAAEPFDEVACQALMRAHAAAGNRAEALRVFADCPKLFRDELGADPSERTTELFLQILKSHS